MESIIKKGYGYLFLLYQYLSFVLAAYAVSLACVFIYRLLLHIVLLGALSFNLYFLYCNYPATFRNF